MSYETTHVEALLRGRELILTQHPSILALIMNGRCAGWYPRRLRRIKPSDNGVCPVCMTVSNLLTPLGLLYLGRMAN